MIQLSRYVDWQTRLHRYLCDSKARVMRPGHHDCCLFGAGAIQAQTGTDIASPYRGRYSTFAGGRRVLRRDGYLDHIALIAAHLPEAPVARGVAGDVAILPTEDGPAVGILGDGGAVYVLHPSGGISLAPMEPVQRLFKVG